MANDWSFWQAQLAGGSPETTPGTPWCGYFHVRERRSWPNPMPEVGGPRRKVATHHYPCAIWNDEHGWHCLIHKREHVVCLGDVDAIDEVFSRCCRSAITYEQYLEETKEEASV